ncbi:hypothetical protein EGT74_27115 [Chitinophaga lutea]|uniref:RHS repeat protein n=1 Tax=Chitinophaga lutea TaxID=2488634 RepID=A0A3N4PBG4_9BACT|nr:hypothetical protein [Chitinophaga lutea]RPE06022.1 hypothetical protein EGT74_27115 [Chitinophaga lutea]
MRRILYLSIFVILFSQPAYSQVTEQGLAQELRKIPVAPSPNASALGKFGDVPVSLSTGIPSISIPFFNYQDQQKRLAMGISLSYHAGGHKVEDMASNVGLGWALNAGGVVSRTMRGRPDDDPYGYINTSVLPYLNTGANARLNSYPGSGTPISEGICLGNSSDYGVVKEVAENERDGECDIFTFNVGGTTGKFFFRKNSSIQLLTQSNIKVSFEPVPGINFTKIDRFIIIDEKGIKYIFDQKEVSHAVNSIAGGFADPAYVSSWYVSKIISADGLDEISLDYYTTSTGLMYEGAFSDSYRSDITRTQSHDILSGTNFVEARREIYMYDSKKIKSISFPDSTRILFNYGFARLDYAGDYALTEIRIKNQLLEKSFALNYDHFETPVCNYTGCVPSITPSPNDGYKRLRLRSVTEKSAGKSLAPYTFEYNSFALPVRNSKKTDWWGYYNNGQSVPMYPPHVPGSDYTTPIFYGGDAVPSEQHAQAWILDKIFYPTGGNTRFVYELNDGFNEGSYRMVGGLRVKRTEDFEPVTGKLNIANYTYRKHDGTSSGVLHKKPMHTWYWASRYMNYREDEGDVPFYEYQMSETAAPSQTLSYFNGSPVVYTRVTVDKNQNGLNNGYSVHEFIATPPNMISEQSFPFLQRQDIEWAQGLQKKDSVFDSNNSLINTTENEYDIHIECPLDIDQNSRNLIAGLIHFDELGTSTMNLFAVRTYVICFGRSELKRTITRSYSAGMADYVENITEHTYDPQYFVPVKTRTQNGKSEPLETRMYYPFSYNTTGFPNRTAMMNANRQEDIISTELWIQKGTSFFLKKSLVTDYGIFNGNLLKEGKTILLETDELLSEATVGSFNPSLLKRHPAFKDNLLVTGYDGRGRYAGMEYPGQLNYAFVWGIGNNYPVATVKNAKLSDVAYTSFETDGSGYWENIQPAGIVSGAGVSGIRFYEGSGFTISRSGLDASKEYKVSYWSRNGAYTVSGTQSGWPREMNAVVVNGQTWRCYQHVVSGLANITVSGSGTLDELRLCPRKAEMTSVAYNPLTGVNTQVDAKDLLVYYEYDEFFRLRVVKDQQGNIVKQICYNYANAKDPCSTDASLPDWQPTGNTRCKPCTANNAYASDRQEREEKDMNPLSGTYNTMRWTETGRSRECSAPAEWQTQSVFCEQVGGVNTGNVISVQRDLNPCSVTYNQTRNVAVQDHAACPPPGCNTVNCSGQGMKCVNGNCETGVKIYTASVFNPSTGMYDCTYHYEFSDGSWSADYMEQSGGECPIF